MAQYPTCSGSENCAPQLLSFRVTHETSGASGVWKFMLQVCASTVSVPLTLHLVHSQPHYTHKCRSV